MIRVFGLLVWRDVLRFGRQPGRMVSSLLAPAVILAVLGGGYGALLQAGTVYRQYLLGGMIVQAMIYSATISGSTLIWDREFGFLRVTALAPVPPFVVVLGRIGGAAIQALFHGFVFVLAAPVVGVWLSPGAFGLVLLITLAMGVALSGLFLAVASRTRTYEDFNAAILFLSIPMLFMSGAHFPVRELPGWLRIIATLNPVTSGVDALKNLFLAGEVAGRWTPDFSMTRDVAVLAAFVTLALVLSVVSFRSREA